MTMFDFNDEKLSIGNEHGHRVDLSLQEAVALLQWVSDNEELLFRLSQYSVRQEDTGRGQIEIYVQQHPLHLDTLKVAPADTVTQHSLELLNAFQLEYKVHPLLEDPDGFAQG